MAQQLFNVILFDSDDEVLTAGSTRADSHSEAVKTVTDNFTSKGADAAYSLRRIRKVLVEIDD